MVLLDGIKIKLDENQKKIGVVLGVILILFLLNVQFGFLSAAGIPAGTIWSITSPDTGMGNVEGKVVTLALNSGAQQLIGQTGRTPATNNIGGVTTVSDLWVEFILNDAGCAWTATQRSPSSLLSYKKLTDVSVSLTAYATDMSYQCSILHPGTTIYSNSVSCGDYSRSVGVGSACDVDYRRVCRATSGNKVVTGISGGAECLRCVRLDEDATANAQLGTFYQVGSPSAKFSAEILAHYLDDARIQHIYISDESVSGTSRTSLITNVDISGGLIQYGVTQCPTGNNYVRSYSGDVTWLNPTKLTEITRLGLFNPITYAEAQNYKTDFNNKVRAYVTEKGFNSGFPITLTRTGSQTTVRYQTKITTLQSGLAQTAPVITMTMNVSKLGIYRPISNVEITNCQAIQTSLANVFSGDTKRVSYNIRNNGERGQYFIEVQSGCSMSFNPSSVSSSLGKDETGSAYFDVIGVQVSSVQERNVVFTVKNGDREVTNTCTIPCKLSPPCDQYAEMPSNAFASGSKWVWNGAPTCAWSCPSSASCPSGTTFRAEPECACVAVTTPPSGGTRDCNDGSVPLPANAHWTNCAAYGWSCDTGFDQIAVGGGYQCQATITPPTPCTTDTQCSSGWSCVSGTCTPPPMTCAQRVDARVCEPLDFTCGINKNIDKIGCSIQDAITVVLTGIVVVAGIGIVGFAAMKYAVPALQNMAKGKGRGRRK